MKTLIICTLLSALALLPLTGCSKKETVEVETIPQELIDLAPEFQKLAGDGKERKEIGEKIRLLLPTYSKKEGADGFVGVDPSTPTYLLTTAKMKELLGKPDEADDQYIVYKLGLTERKRWELVIEHSDDRVFCARLEAKSIRR